MGAEVMLLHAYGEPNAGYQLKYCTMWEITKDFPELADIPNAATPDPNDTIHKVMINKDFKNKLFKAFTLLRDKGLLDEIKEWNGCFNSRSVRGRNSTSLHAWAAAIDINASTEKLAQNSTNWSDEFLQTMRDAGIFCGADWKGRKDSMHFAFRNG